MSKELEKKSSYFVLGWGNVILQGAEASGYWEPRYGGFTGLVMLLKRAEDAMDSDGDY